MKSGAAIAILFALVACPALGANLRADPKKDDKKAEKAKPKGPCEKAEACDKKIEEIAKKDPADPKLMEQYDKKKEHMADCKGEAAQKAAKEAEEKLKKEELGKANKITGDMK